MDLGKHVLDRGLLDRHGHRAGKVDDLMLEIGDPLPGGTLPCPKVSAIVTGPMALTRIWPAPFQRLAGIIYRLLGLRDAHPVEIGWDKVTRIDVVVHLDIDRDSAGLRELANAVDRRFIGRLPGA